MPRIYLAARYSRRLELVGYRDQLEEFDDVTVTSRWLNGTHQIDDAGVPIGDDGERLVEDPLTDLPAGDHPKAVAMRERFAVEDLQDVMGAEVLVAFTEPPRSSASRGGRHVELGIALGLIAARSYLQLTPSGRGMHPQLWIGSEMREVVIVGPRENVFTHLPSLVQFDEWPGAHEVLQAVGS